MPTDSSSKPAQPDCAVRTGGRQLLSQGAFTLVERCGCGAVYLSVGPVCLRLDPAALPELSEVIRRATFILMTEASAEDSKNFGDASEPGEAADAGGGGSGSETSVEPSPPNKLN